jgi:hypothetical protein
MGDDPIHSQNIGFGSYSVVRFRPIVPAIVGVPDLHCAVEVRRSVKCDPPQPTICVGREILPPVVILRRPERRPCKPAILGAEDGTIVKIFGIIKSEDEPDLVCYRPGKQEITTTELGWEDILVPVRRA